MLNFKYTVLFVTSYFFMNLFLMSSHSRKLEILIIIWIEFRILKHAISVKLYKNWYISAT